MKTLSLLRRLILAALVTTSTAYGCSVCGCSLSSDWAALGYPISPGVESDFRFEYFEQAQLRSGTDAVSRAALSVPNDAEIQQRTVNRNTWLDVNFVASSTWAVSLALPWHDRFHSTIAAGDTEISAVDSRGFGDLRLLGRYQHSGANQILGLQFGLKLPTGRFDQDFASGPQAGSLLDRGLQLGTGTTDFIGGLAWFARAPGGLGCFAQGTVDLPFAAREGFLPSASVNLNGGLRWLNQSRFTPQLQVNLKVEGREHGPEGDRENSGGKFAFISPGISAELNRRISAYVFVQAPIYQRVNGLQLEPRWLFSGGVRWRW